MLSFFIVGLFRLKCVVFMFAIFCSGGIPLIRPGIIDARVHVISAVFQTECFFPVRSEGQPY
jgi:hypothetical protein